MTRSRARDAGRHAGRETVSRKGRRRGDIELHRPDRSRIDRDRLPGPGRDAEGGRRPAASRADDLLGQVPHRDRRRRGARLRGRRGRRRALRRVAHREARDHARPPGRLPRHRDVGGRPAGRARALGVIETFSASSIIDVADAAAKCADVTLFRIHLAMALGGKGFVLLTGDIASVEAAVATGCPGRRRRRHSRRPGGHRRPVEGAVPRIRVARPSSHSPRREMSYGDDLAVHHLLQRHAVPRDGEGGCHRAGTARPPRGVPPRADLLRTDALQHGVPRGGGRR